MVFLRTLHEFDSNIDFVVKSIVSLCIGFVKTLIGFNSIIGSIHSKCFFFESKAKWIVSLLNSIPKVFNP